MVSYLGYVASYVLLDNRPEENSWSYIMTAGILDIFSKDSTGYAIEIIVVGLSKSSPTGVTSESIFASIAKD